MMNDGHGGVGGSGAEADRWLVTAEKLLASSDPRGAKSFAIRACETDPSSAEAADCILAVCDTLLAGETRLIGAGGDASLPDWYAVLRLARLSHPDPELIAAQYRRLAALLNPTVNRLPFSDQAHRVVTEAWLVLSDPSKKALYDRELQTSQLGSHQSSQSRNQNHGQQEFMQFRQQREQNHHHQQQQQPSHQFQWQGSNKTLAEPPKTGAHQFASEEMPNLNNSTDSKRKTRPSEPASAEPKIPSFWTSCPYCLVLYEYPKDYEECILRCQSCRRAFEAVTVQTPPVTGDGKDDYFCSWSFFPLGFSGHFKPIGWSPVSPLFLCPTKIGEVNQSKANFKKPASAPRIYYDDDDVYVEISGGDDDDDDDDGDDWENEETKKTKKAKLGKGKGSNAKNNKKQKLGNFDKADRSTGNNVGSIGDQESIGAGSSSGVAKAVGGSGRKRIGTGAAKNLGRLDLNVECSNEVEETAVTRGRVEGNLLGNREVDNIEGIGFFEGLDEFLNSLPILSVVADDKVKTT